MRNEFQIKDTLQTLAPAGMCSECIGDRLPLSARAHLDALINELKPPNFERVTGECVACLQVKRLIRVG